MQGDEEFSNHHGEEPTQWPDHTTLNIDPGAQQQEQMERQQQQQPATRGGVFDAIQSPKNGVLGNSTRRCGCCIIPEKSCAATTTLAIFILIPTAVFLTSVIPHSEWYSFVVVLFLLAGAYTMQLLAVSCDPGIIPRQPNAPPVVPGHVTLSDGTQVLEKVCLTCNVIRPPRSSHCNQCDYCVEEYDHHCGVVGSCVAKRTFRFFTLYFYFLTPLALYVFIRSCIFLSSSDWSSLGTMSDWERWQFVAALGCTFYTACGGCCTLGQAGMYTEMSCANTTAKLRVQGARAGREGLRGGMYTTDDADKRYSCGSWCSRLCGPIPKSKV